MPAGKRRNPRVRRKQSEKKKITWKERNENRKKTRRKLERKMMGTAYVRFGHRTNQ